MTAHHILLLLQPASGHHPHTNCQLRRWFPRPCDQKGRDARGVLDLANDTSGIPPAHVVFCSTSILLNMIQVYITRYRVYKQGRAIDGSGS